MRRATGRWLPRLAILAIGAALAPPVRAAVDLEWRPAVQVVGATDLVEVGCYLVSDNGFDQSVGGVDIVLTWDHEMLALVDSLDPCTAEPCDAGSYDWLQSGMPSDPQLDRLNDDCADDLFCEEIPCSQGCPSETGCNNATGFCNRGSRLFNDGDAFYRAFSRFRPSPSAFATPEGLLVTTFRFRVVRPGVARVRMEATLGGASQTRVVDGEQAGVVVTGTIGPPARVDIESCPAPIVEAIGSRYFAVTPRASIDPVAIRIDGDPSDSAVDCVGLYVNPFGTLVTAPVFRMSDAWGTVLVSDAEIQPSRTYRVQIDCTQTAPGMMSDVVEVTTWIWGDTDANQDVEVADILRVYNGVQGLFEDGAYPESLDLMPCAPDGLVDEADFAAVQSAFSGEPFPCAVACSPGPTIDDLPEFVACLAGPAVAPSGGCECDLTEDGICDLADFAAYQRRFTAP
jgi:hypothetical protein